MRKKYFVLMPVFFTFLIFVVYKLDKESYKNRFLKRSLHCFTIDEIMRGPAEWTQDDPRIVEYVFKNYLVPPSNLNYNFTNPKITDPSMGQSTIIKQILGNMTNGFFIECGAYNGEGLSNTLNLEKEFGWNGLLIEANKNNYKDLETKNRKAWIAHLCLSINTFPSVMNFKYTKNPKAGQIVEPGQSGGEENVTCLPFYTLMAALSVKNIDYFSLDIEGFEYRVLKTIPFDKLNIKTFSIEYRVDKAGEKGINEIMATKGYYPIAKVIKKTLTAHDNIYVHKSVVLKNKTAIKDIIN